MLTRREAAQWVGGSIDLITVWRVRGILLVTIVDGRWRFAPSNLAATPEKQYAGDVRPRWRADPTRAGARLGALWEVVGFPQRDIERACGLHQDHVSSPGCGRWVPRGATIHRLADALGVLTATFVNDVPPEEMRHLTTREGTTLLGVPPIRVRRWAAAGVLPGRKVGEHWQIPHEAAIAL